MDLLDLIQLVVFIGSAFLVAFLLGLYILLKNTTTPFPVVKRFAEENVYLDTKTNTKEKFPSLNDDPIIDLSVVIPAYNEESRLPLMIEECLAYLTAKQETNSQFKYEIIVVSDGSSDNTVACGQRYTLANSAEHVRVLPLIVNRGKGGAVRLGMQSTRGKYLLFADADGATQFSDFDKLEKSMKNLAPSWETEAVVIGSRAHLEKEAIATRSMFRNILMVGFHSLVWLFAVKKIRDTQCGFKLMTRSAARRIFSLMHVERWAFDVELLFIAQSFNMPIEEIAVNWTEIDGSKVTPVWSWIQMGCDLFLIWFRYATGSWKLKKQHSE